MPATPLCSCGKPSPDARLCRGCTRELAAALTMAAAIADDLDDAVARLLTRGQYGKTPPRAEAPLPIDLAASDIAYGLRNCLSGWVRILYRDGDQWPRDDIAGTAAWLRARLAVIRQHEAAAEVLADVSAHMALAVAVIDRPPDLRPAGDCEACGIPLRAEPSADMATCPCGAVNTGIARRRAERAASADVLGSADEVSAALAAIGITVSGGTIRKWASRGRLAQRPGAVYAMSDVLAVCAERDSRRAG